MTEIDLSDIEKEKSHLKLLYDSPHFLPEKVKEFSKASIHSHLYLFSERNKKLLLEKIRKKSRATLANVDCSGSIKGINPYLSEDNAVLYLYYLCPVHFFVLAFEAMTEVMLEVKDEQEFKSFSKLLSLSLMFLSNVSFESFIALLFNGRQISGINKKADVVIELTVKANRKKEINLYLPISIKLSSLSSDTRMVIGKFNISQDTCSNLYEKSVEGIEYSLENDSFWQAFLSEANIEKKTCLSQIKDYDGKTNKGLLKYLFDINNIDKEIIHDIIKSTIINAVEKRYFHILSFWFVWDREGKEIIQLNLDQELLTKLKLSKLICKNKQKEIEKLFFSDTELCFKQGFHLQHEDRNILNLKRGELFFPVFHIKSLVSEANKKQLVKFSLPEIAMGEFIRWMEYK